MISLADLPKRPVSWELYPDGTLVEIIRFFEERIRILELMLVQTEWKPFHVRWEFHYGCRFTGRSWEDKDVGYVGLTHVPGTRSVVGLAAFSTKTSSNGNLILPADIVKLTPANSRVNDGRPIYRHPLFFVPKEAQYQRDFGKAPLRQHRRINVRIK